jgi:Na+/citrate or Na+/malate symporter
MYNTWRKEGLTDVINLVVGALLFLTPWTLGFVGERTISWNAWVSGAAIFAVAIVALVAFTEWEEWINVALGVWVALSPWILGFYANATATDVHLAAGLAVALLAGVRLWFVHRDPPRITA